MKASEAYSLAWTKKDELRGPYELLSATDNQPIQMPGGWRVPFDVHLPGDWRLRDKMVILFVDESGEVEVEWNDIEEIDHDAVTEYQQQKPGLPKFTEIQDKLQKEYPELQLETAEPVLGASPENKIQPHWRLGVNHYYSRKRYVIMGGLAPGGTTYLTQPESRSKGVALKWKIGRSQYNPQSGNIIVKLKSLPTDQTDLRSRWMAWSCMAHATERLIELEYHKINPHNFLIELIDTGEIREGAKFDQKENIPVISLSQSGGWTDDPTIICHELGHAVWYLLFTRPAKSIVELIKEHKYHSTYDGIGEGFADYFAATLLVRGRKTGTIAIGEYLPQETVDLHGGILRRQVDGCYREISPDISGEEKKYDIGKKWANLLWNLRQCIGAHKADAIIFRAHFKPLVSDNAPTEPLAAYFQSLLKTADYFKIHFDGWDKLAREHRLTLPSA